MFQVGAASSPSQCSPRAPGPCQLVARVFGGGHAPGATCRANRRAARACQAARTCCTLCVLHPSPSLLPQEMWRDTTTKEQRSRLKPGLAWLEIGEREGPWQATREV